MIPCAYLRVFRPLESFPDGERARWERYIVAGAEPPRHLRVYREEAAAPRGGVGLLAAEEADHADIRLVDGRYYVCPWRTRLRVLASILSLRETAADVAAFVPESEARRAAKELARMKRRDPMAVPTMLQSPWHVPVRWFVLVDDDERHLVETPQGEHRLYYWTALPKARRRAERAREVLRRSELAPVADVVRDLAEWLAAFPMNAAVELDYGGVASLFGWDELDNDHSGRDIGHAIDALAERGGMARAVELYQTVAFRWAEVRSRESLN